MPTTPISGITYPLNSEPPNAPVQMASFLGTIDTQLIPRFTNAATRDSRITSPVKGMICYLLDVRYFTIYRDNQWKKITIPVIRRLTTPVSYINNTTRSVVAPLTIPVLAGKKYRLEGVLFLVTPSVDIVDASLDFNHPGGTLVVHNKFLSSSDTSLAGINIRRQSNSGAAPFTAGVVDKTPFFIDGIYSCTVSGDLTISAAQGTLSAVELRIETGSYWIAKEF